MQLQRRGFLSLALGSLAAATFTTNAALASALDYQSPTDLIATTVRMSRAVDAAWNEIPQGVTRDRSAPVMATYNRLSDELVEHLLHEGFGMPRQLDVALFFDLPQFWNFDALDERSLHGISLDLVPIATVRFFVQRRKQPVFSMLNNVGVRFADRFRDVIMMDHDTVDPRYTQFVNLFKQAEDNGRTEVVANMRESMMEYRRTRTGLYLPSHFDVRKIA